MRTTRHHARHQTALPPGDNSDEITLLDYFAARAPQDIPDWFQPSYPEYEGPAYPAIPEGIPEEDRKMLASWTKDGCWDLEGEYAWFQEAAETYRQARENHDYMCKMGAYYEWRWEYAESMVTFRKAVVGDEVTS
jgi:hypothetical protein